MKDYRINKQSYTNKLQIGENKIFQNQLNLEGKIVIINNKECKVIIRNHGNPTNEFKEERYLIVPKNININRGSIVKYLDENYLVITDIDIDEFSYNTCKIKKCSNILTIDEGSQLLIVPCLLNKISNDIDTKELILSNNLQNIIVPYNLYTNKIQYLQRFAFNHNSIFKVINIDDFTFKKAHENFGLLQLTLQKDMIDEGLDNLELNIADNSHLKKEIPIKLEIGTKEIRMKLGDKYKLNPKLIQDKNEINNINDITYDYDDTLLYLDKNLNIIPKKTGKDYILIKYQSQRIKIPITIINEEVNSSNCSIIGDNFIKISRINEWKIEFHDENGKIINKKANWELIAKDKNVDIKQLIKIYKKDDHSIILCGIYDCDNIGKKFIIKCRNGICCSNEKEIEIKNIY